jgi:predicted ATPase/class 3 adenylate cyclase
MAANLPSGTITFLFTDIEGSTTIAEKHPETWEAVRARHDAIMRSVINGHQGHVFQIVGDACCAAFDSAAAGLQAAVDIQRQVRAEPWGDMPVRVRIGIHTGEAQAQAGDYRGYLTLAHVTRVMSSAHGGQILLSNATAQLVGTELAGEISLKDLGQHRLRSLRSPENIWQLIAPGLEQDFPPLESVGTITNNLPVQLTSFVGREKELVDVIELLRSQRLVTLTGAGGTGKTRLSLRVAAELLDNFKDGVYFVELASLSEPALLPNAVASVLNVREEPGHPLMTTILDWLGNRELLLVLDNCEHLIDASAKFADSVLHSNRAASILATSREALGIAGESAYHVPSLESPELTQASDIPVHELTQYPAVRLFAERAKEALVSFNITETNAREIAQICHRLDGIPLAIELAAARVKVLGVGQIAARLDDRFRLLTGGGRTSLPRHQTLRSLIDWSYGLLSDPERMLLRRLSAFAGGWTLEAAEQVCTGNGIAPPEVLDLLTHLVDKSLVTVTPAAQEARYGFLETIRQYALEKLIDSGEVEYIRGQHLKFIQGVAEDIDATYFGSGDVPWFDQMELELDNVRAALEWALRLENAEGGLQLAGTLVWFWYTRRLVHEGHRWLDEALGRPGAEKRTQGRAKALAALGLLQIATAEYGAGQFSLDESVSICRQLGDRHSLAHTLAWQGSFAGLWGDYSGGSRVLGEALELSRELNDTLGMGLSLVGLGNLKASEGNDKEARLYYEQGSTHLRKAGDLNMLAWTCRRLGHVTLRSNKYQQAFALFAESLNLNLQIGDMRGAAACLAAIGSISLRQGNASVAGRLYGASDALLESVSEQLMPIDVAELEPYVRAAREQMGEEAYTHAFLDGRAMNMDQAVACAREQAY